MDTHTKRLFQAVEYDTEIGLDGCPVAHHIRRARLELDLKVEYLPRNEADRDLVRRLLEVLQAIPDPPPDNP